MNSSSIPPSGHYLVFISKKWHLFLLCLHIRLCKIQLEFSSLALLINQNDSGLSVGFGNPCLPLLSHSGGSWLSNIGFTAEFWGMPVCGHKYSQLLILRLTFCQGKVSDPW